MSARFLGLLSLLGAILAADGLAGPGAGRRRAQAEIATAPVELDGVVLFRVRGVSSFPADQRARVIRDRLAEAAADPAVSVDALRLVEADGVTRIVAGSVMIMSIVDADAILEQVNRTELAAAHLIRLRQAFTDYREARSSAAVWRDVIRSLTATLLLAVTIVVLRWYWRWVDRFLERRLHRRIQSVGIQSFELMRGEQSGCSAGPAGLVRRSCF